MNEPIRPRLAENTKVSIEGLTFEIREFDVLTAFKISGKLFPLLGDAIKSAKTGGSKEGLTLEALGGLMNRVTPELLEEIRFECAKVSCVKIDGNWPELSVRQIFANTFTRRTGLLYRWLFEVLKYNFSDFLAGLQTAKAPAEKAE